MSARYLSEKITLNAVSRNRCAMMKKSDARETSTELDSQTDVALCAM